MNSLQKELIINYAEYKNIASRYSGNRSTADDIIQNAYIQLGRDGYIAENINSYVKKTIFNVMLNEIRRNKRYATYTEVKEVFWITERTAEDELRDIELRKKLKESIIGDTKLDKILRMKLLDHMNYAEIALELNMTTDQVRANLKVNKFHGRLDYLRGLL